MHNNNNTNTHFLLLLKHYYNNFETVLTKWVLFVSSFSNRRSCRLTILTISAIIGRSRVKIIA